jgi:hypothetical protein
MDDHVETLPTGWVTDHRVNSLTLDVPAHLDQTPTGMVFVNFSNRVSRPFVSVPFMAKGTGYNRGYNEAVAWTAQSIHAYADGWNPRFVVDIMNEMNKDLPMERKRALTASLLATNTTVKGIGNAKRIFGMFDHILPLLSKHQLAEMTRDADTLFTYGEVVFLKEDRKSIAYCCVNDVRMYVRAALQRMYLEEGLGSLSKEAVVTLVVNVDGGGVGKTQSSKLSVTICAQSGMNSAKKVLVLGMMHGAEDHENLDVVYAPLLHSLIQLRGVSAERI